MVLCPQSCLKLKTWLNFLPRRSTLIVNCRQLSSAVVSLSHRLPHIIWSVCNDRDWLCIKNTTHNYTSIYLY